MVLLTDSSLSNVADDDKEPLGGDMALSKVSEEESPEVLVEAKAVGPQVKAAIRDNRET
jgi:hypothetical protein